MVPREVVAQLGHEWRAEVATDVPGAVPEVDCDA